MALTISYETPTTAFTATSYLYRATSGGTVFTAIPYNSTSFDYFDDSAVVDDALYFSYPQYGMLPTGLSFNVGTAIAATSYTLVWEYYKWNDDGSYGWAAIEDIVDNTNSFSTLGANIVDFPQQWQPHYQLGIGSAPKNCLFVRCRISALSGWTEGGANTTTQVKSGYGRLYVSGTTEEAPASFEDVYQWLLTNKPNISVSKPDAYSYDFTKVGLVLNSPLASYNETVYLGQNCKTNNGQGYNNFNYILTGTKLSDTKGYGGSTFIVHGLANQSVFTFGVHSKCYGATFRTGKSQADTYNYAGYCDMKGEIIDCNIELSTKVPSSSSDFISNCRITGSLLIALSLRGTYSNIFYLCTGTKWMYIYRDGFTLSGLGYAFKNTTGAYVFYLYQGSDRGASPEWILLDPATPLNSLASGTYPKPIIFNSYHSTTAIYSVKYYDTSAGTYTDYTTQAQSTTQNDVPLDGDVGDIYYFGISSYSIAYGLNLYFNLPTQSNDYQYIWEYYSGGSWLDINTNDFLFDSTFNFTQLGYVHCGMPYPYSAQTVDGTSAYWVRCRIVSKGSATPKAHQVLQERCSGVSGWSLKEKYSFDVNVSDSDGSPIANATVTVNDENGNEVFSASTDANGDIATQQVLAKEWHFDPVNNYTTGISENIYSYVTIAVEKNGYETYSEIISSAMSSKTTKSVCLKTAKRFRYTDSGDTYFNLDQANSGKLIQLTKA